jgi:carbonic anhydrase
MQYLVEGHRWFRSRVFPAKRGLYESLGQGQRPAFLCITCSDSRVQPHEFTQADAGYIFMDRSIGNLVPPPGGDEHEALAVIEYAVIALGVSHIIICGHSKCGAMQALLNPESLRGMPSVSAWLRHASGTLEAVRAKYGHLEGEELLDAAIRENVLIQLGRLCQVPCVASRLEEGKLDVHGWVYDFERGEAVAYDPQVERFVPLDEAYRFAES